MAYEKNGEWGGYKITEAKTGWVVTTWSRIQGCNDGFKALVPYGVWDYQKGQDLSAMHNEIMEVGSALADYAVAGENKTKILEHGEIVR